MENIKAKEYALFHIDRKIINLSKNFLVLLEDSNLPTEIYSRIRKRVLDNSNDTIREIHEDFNRSINIDFKT